MNEKAALKVYKNSNLIRELAFTLYMFTEYEIIFLIKATIWDQTLCHVTLNLL